MPNIDAIKSHAIDYVNNCIDSILSKHNYTINSRNKQFEINESLFTRIIRADYIQHFENPQSNDYIYAAITIEFKYISTKFNKWLKREFKILREYSKVFSDHTVIVAISKDQVDKDSCTSTAAANFKQSFREMAAINKLSAAISIDDFIETTFLDEIAKFHGNSLSDLLNDPDVSLTESDTLFHLFSSNKKTQIAQIQTFLDAEIKRLLAFNQLPLIHVRKLEEFVEKINNYYGEIKYSLPFERKITTSSKCEESLGIQGDITYKNYVTFELHNFEVFAHAINANGKILILTERIELMLFNSNGNIELEFKPNIGLTRIEYSRCCALLSNSDKFHCYNMVISDDGIVLTLEIPDYIVPPKDKCVMCDIIYNDGNYHMLYCDHILIYSCNGTLISSQKVTNGYATQFYTPDLVLAETAKNTHEALDLTCKSVFAFKGNITQNPKISISDNKRYIASWFYNPKSIIYDTVTNISYTIWAHPKYLKGYVETLYSDTYHNFGMNRFNFSPDCEYAIGEGDHSKYVAWEIPSWKRVELIPNEEAMKLIFNSDSKSIPSTKKIGSEIFFIDRIGYSLGFHFFNNGEYFGIQLSTRNILLVWNKNFQCIKSLLIDGRIKTFGDTFMSISNGSTIKAFTRS